MTDRLTRPEGRESAGRFGPVASDLVEVEKLILRQVGAPEPHLLPAAAHTREAGGKRLRPAAFLLLVRVLGERPGLPHIVTAAVLELCHTASLLHDDVLDHASVRRGRASLRTVRGNREAILYGDHILAGAFELLADLARPELISVMACLVREVCSGEIRQWARRSFDIAEAEYLAIVKSKTASFFRFAGTLAGRMSHLGREQTGKLEEWGDSFGTAYQIADDLYDLVSPAGADKSTQRDAEAGLLTLPWIMLRDRHGKRELLKRYLPARSRGAGAHALLGDELLREAIIASGLLAEDFLAHARAILEELPSSEAREALIAFCTHLCGTVAALARQPR